MKKIFYIIAVSLLVFLALGRCTRETINPDDPQGDVTTKLSLSFPLTRASSDPEKTINSLRVIIFRSDSWGNETGFVVNKLITLPVGGEDEVDITEIVPVGYLNLYLIANEDPLWNLGSVNNPTALNSKLLDYNANINGYITPSFTMYSVYKAVKIDMAGNITHPDKVVSGTKTIFPIERVVAKLTVTIDCEFSDLGNRAIALDSAMIVSMPLKPYLVPTLYPGLTSGDYFKSGIRDISSGYFAAQSFASTPGFSTISGKELLFYLPEHVLSNANRSNFTYLKLVGHMVSSPTTTLTYRVPLGNSLGVLGGYTADYLLEHFADVPAAALTITRNTHYDLKLKIIGFGERNHMEVNAVVKPWAEVGIIGSHQDPYIYVSTVSAEVSGFAGQRVYFWSNQPEVYLQLDGRVLTSGGSSFMVDDIFNNVSGPSVAGVYPLNFHYNYIAGSEPGTGSGSGYFDLLINSGMGNFSSTRYLLYLTSSHLQREVEVYASNVSPSSFPGWLYVRKGATGNGTSWSDAAPSIAAALTQAKQMVAAGYNVRGILVAGGADKLYAEAFDLTSSIAIYGGWEGLPGTELTSSAPDAPYLSAARDLDLYKTILSPGDPNSGLAAIHIKAGSALDGFIIQASSADTVVAVAGGAHINAVEFINNRPSGPVVSLTGTGTVGSNILVAENNSGVSISAGAVMDNSTIVKNTGTLAINNATLLNSITWHTTVSFSGTNTIEYCALHVPSANLPTGTGNVLLNADNTAWFTTSNVIPGPHFNLGADPTRPYYSALNDRAPMLGRGNAAAFTTHTSPFMPIAKQTDDLGHGRDYLGTDIGCYEDAVFEGFKLRWASERVYISTKVGTVNEIPLLLPENATQQIGVNWTVTVNPGLQYCTFNGPFSGSGTGVMIDVLKATTTTGYTAGAERLCGSFVIHTTLGGYLIDTVVQIWQIPGTMALWENGYVGAFFRNNETSERYITGENSYGVFSGTPGSSTTVNRAYYTHWSARIVSGVDWIKIDTNPKGFNGGEVIETWGSVVSGVTSGAAGGAIRFRVGTKSVNPNPSQPRYGLIVISRGNDPTNFAGATWFFVRQGEADDYLYRSSDPTPTGTRGTVARFSPYNVMVSGTVNDGGVNVRSNTALPSTAILTSYPSIAGAFFQRNATIGYRRGWPIGTNSVQTSNLPANAPSSWVTGRDVCPDGYRHPTYIEMQNSLYEIAGVPSATDPTTMRQFLWGYYADGHFDQIAPDPVSSDDDGHKMLGIATTTTNTVAGKGMLMVNHNNYASLFFPMAGTMLQTSPTAIGQDYGLVNLNMGTNTGTGAIWVPSLYRGYTGVSGMYPAAATSGNNTHWTSGHVGLSCTTIATTSGSLIRCVKD